MALIEEITKILTEFGINLNDDTRSSLRKKLDERASKHSGRRVTSRLEASIKPSVTYSNGSVTFKLNMNDYWGVVNDGRKPSNVSEEGQDKIAEWSATRGLAEKIRITDLQLRKQKQSLSKRKSGLKSLKKMPFDRAKRSAGFLVARALKRKRLEPTHFFDEVIEDGRIDELRKKLAEAMKSEIRIEILRPER